MQCSTFDLVWSETKYVGLSHIKLQSFLLSVPHTKENLRRSYPFSIPREYEVPIFKRPPFI
ncbi:MAG: hypothetical protein A2V96_02240 [Candidatus Yonathbacteria bacterium RBG_16_43_6]|uniref:Uncharacterized protein n=1 Tax=Candidatus Yonathbacteria bacterium RIFCSPLOWO2_01_FULL_43_27 TaxID=1802726 RepID=A0A1G2SE01_9BACT|nr:MAG: hypothetical protein A2V96_02240 [Candidatus Yonathbacteria bacterium RBG_16_43_6]OHA78706.1 MAG: hypothetical protein A2658_01045 [Candidatus Yonathbacteria bacterium RIFCSPHIGHO2_01_FULL_44_19]OHA83195.1 MAG: hypothetical protein A3B07_00295 [Candidatus Yonathbacteria bacterium RIFCSPLOWO2_01_FULL_43_27]